ncbi:hypothetical protein EVA_02412 [gut metagenome]|uniref:Uncharacterized protein n=1 Tax=gut metagenome TaxID=749906 RepID=J9H617_9ZZZZ
MINLRIGPVSRVNKGSEIFPCHLLFFLKKSFPFPTTGTDLPEKLWIPSKIAETRCRKSRRKNLSLFIYSNYKP